jgi:aspartate aminotransferase-like enzyme
VPCFADAWGIDAIYSGSQKCLSAPPGAAPLFFSQRAVDKLKNRKTKPATYNLDMNLIGEQWKAAAAAAAAGGGGVGVQNLAHCRLGSQLCCVLCAVVCR